MGCGVQGLKGEVHLGGGTLWVDTTSDIGKCSTNKLRYMQEAEIERNLKKSDELRR